MNGRGRQRREKLDPARRAAFDVLRAVSERDAYANLALPALLAERGITGRDAAFATELTYGTCRTRGLLDAVISAAAGRPIDQIDSVLLDLLRLGTYQLLRTHVAGHAAVSTTVEQAGIEFDSVRAGFVNGVLRTISKRDEQSWVNQLAPDAAADPIGHAGPHVQVLASYCNFAAIYRISPEGLKAQGGGVTDEQHALLQKLAWETVSKYAYSGVTVAQAASATRPERRGTRTPIVVNADDVPAFAEPAEGFDKPREGIAHGRLEMIEYDSKTVGTKRKMHVYTPPGYDKDNPGFDKDNAAKKYPVLYLLHGIGGDETEWQRFAQPGVLLDNLIADGKAVPMIVVMPNGRAQKNDRAEGNVFAAAPAFATFERDLLENVIPAIESRYRTLADRDHRALAGLSMGGGQSLNFGLSHLDTFGSVGGFSSAPNTKKPADLVPDPEAVKQLKLLFLSCGTKDSLFPISQGFHSHLKAQSIPHTWHVTTRGHDGPEWKQALFHFVQNVFR